MTGDSVQITIDFWLLDAVLTGHDPRSGRGDPDKWVSLEDLFYGREYYLSDGGYSRVFYSFEHQQLFLTSNSRPEVVAKWNAHAASVIRRRLETRLILWMEI